MRNQRDDRTMRDAMGVAGTQAGKQLLQMLHSNHAAAMEEAGKYAQAGDLAQAKKALERLLTDPNVASLLRKAQEERHG